MPNGHKENAFRSLYDRHSTPLFRFIYRFTLNNQSAEEIIHDIFIQLLSGKFILDTDSNLKGWLYTIARNKCLNHLKKNAHEIADDSVIENTASDNDLETNFIGENLLGRLSSLENKLPTDLRETWRLRKDGFDYREIAEKLSIPVGTVKSRFSRLVTHLKKEFQQ